MKKVTLFKVLAILNFIGLITLFLLFKNGTFDLYFESNKKLTTQTESSPTQLSNDTITQKIDSTPRQMLSSSKSMVLIDDIELNTDTSINTKDTLTGDSTKAEKRLMPSSKSGTIISPPIPNIDWFKLKPRNLKKHKNE